MDAAPGRTGAYSVSLDRGWQFARVDAGACASPSQLGQLSLQWRHATVPGTVAESLDAGFDSGIDFDADDWWYQTRFAAPEAAADARFRLRFHGLATLARVWLNGEEILASQNMFVSSSVDATDLLRPDNVLHIAFLSLKSALAQRKPRPRWKTALVGEQNLRWFRTTLLGRIPGWSPPVAAVGPWKDIVLERHDGLAIDTLDIQTGVDNGIAWLRLRAGIAVHGGAPIAAARLRLDDRLHELPVSPVGQSMIDSRLTLPDVPLWWPHTHGTPALLTCVLELQAGGEWLRFDCGKIGFKHVAVDQSRGGAQFSINGVPVFCRGACWTTLDIFNLRGSADALRRALETAREAGANMLRVGGTMVYESDDFYRLCDELGILVWQDFMFANMDYPFGDAAFGALAGTEIDQQLARLQRHVCVAAYCGGSEVAQQAAMLGLPASDWCHTFFSETLPGHCRHLHAGIPYFPSTPWGGALPFHVGSGVSHYYGVGAYRRPLSDARAARVRFTTECLGFSNVPDEEMMNREFGGRIPPHHPRWKARLPRDSGPGWDFEDIRDHYLGLLFGCDAVTLRGLDLERYYALARVTSGEVMQRVFSEWRNPADTCGGALVWFYRDLWPGAGWGITDSAGGPKAALWYLKRAWAPQTVRLTDEGLDGIAMHVFNERALPLVGEVELEMFRDGRVPTASARTVVEVPPRGAVTLSGDAMLGYFTDSNWAYRFGPPKQDVIAVRLTGGGQLLGEDFYFPAGMALPRQHGHSVQCTAEWEAADRVAVTVASDVFLQAVCVSSPGASPSDNYFHLAPKREKRVLFTLSEPTASRFKAEFQALNLAESFTARLQRE